MSSFICLGDFGTGNDIQLSVSKLIENLDKNIKCKFIIGLGDNIYPSGIKNVKDKKLETNFEKPYDNIPKRIQFYNCLGNHDYLGSVKSQIKYTNYSDRWVLPSNYYYFFKKINNTPINFFAIDTNLYNEIDRKKDVIKQEEWLISRLNNNNNSWNIVFGHHPWKSSGSHGNCNEDLDEFYNKISNTGNVDMILSGHDHDQQHFYIPNKPHLFISGTGGDVRPLDKYIRKMKSNRYLQYYTEQPGCLQIIPRIDMITINIWVTDSKENHKIAYTVTIEKRKNLNL